MIDFGCTRGFGTMPEAEWNRLLSPDAPPFVHWAFSMRSSRPAVSPLRGVAADAHDALGGGQSSPRLPRTSRATAKGSSSSTRAGPISPADCGSVTTRSSFSRFLSPPRPVPGCSCPPKPSATACAVAVAEGVEQARSVRRGSRVRTCSSRRRAKPSTWTARVHAALGMQYQWHNQGFETFEDFLSTFSSKRETRSGANVATGKAGSPNPRPCAATNSPTEAIDSMYEFYTLTVDKFTWGRQYLNREFFFDICERIKDNVEIVLAKEASKPSPARSIHGAERLYGRYWGAREERPFLHFEVCYYHSIDNASCAGSPGSSLAREVSTSARAASRRRSRTARTSWSTRVSRAQCAITSGANASTYSA